MWVSSRCEMLAEGRSNKEFFKNQRCSDAYSCSISQILEQICRPVPLHVPSVMELQSTSKFWWKKCKFLKMNKEKTRSQIMWGLTNFASEKRMREGALPWKAPSVTESFSILCVALVTYLNVVYIHTLKLTPQLTESHTSMDSQKCKKQN